MNKWFTTLTFFSSVQWFLFIFVNTVVVPISISTVFELSSEMTETMLSSSLVFTGLACIFQGWVGHRFPLMEGHSGLLWGVILNLGLSASSLGMSLTTIGGGIATGIILACLVTILLTLMNGISLLKSVFSPMVMTVYLFLLTFQLIFIFFKGMFPLTENGTINVPISIFSIGIVIFVSAMKLKGSKALSNFSILLGLIVGWILYDLLFVDGMAINAVSNSHSYFTLFPLGNPNLEMGIVVVTFLAVMLNLTNTVASIRTGDILFNKKSSEKNYRNSILITTIFSFIGTGFGLVPYTPFSSSIGFLQSTRIFHRLPFFIGGVLLTLVGLIPVISTFLATMPITVGHAVLFVAYLQLFGTAFSSLGGKTFNSTTIFRFAAPILVGISLMNMPATVFSNLPILIQPFITNGLIMGVLISILFEKLVNWSAFEQLEVVDK
jgi:xanthine/uracil permease